MKIEREIVLKKTTLDILMKSAKHYQMGKSNLIELLFIISLDRDTTKSISVSNNPTIQDKEKVKIFIQISENNLSEMYAVAKYYKKTISKYIELLITTSKQVDGVINL